MQVNNKGETRFSGKHFLPQEEDDAVGRTVCGRTVRLTNWKEEEQTVIPDAGMLKQSQVHPEILFLTNMLLLMN